jgi:HD-GYP domain-containing protein (c-di-GMP phosphodiesterase class II)
LRDGAGKHFDPEIVRAFEFIVPALYAEIGKADQGYLQTALKMIVKEYF